MRARPDRVPFGRYFLKERLAKGGMGEVFRAVAVGERGFEKSVVIKRILPVYAAMSELAEFFVEEAKLMTRLSHPNVVEVLDFGRGEGGDYFLVLEYVPGLDLERLASWIRARGDRFPISLALYIGTQALRGLHHAHVRAKEEGLVLVHRDVSPSNILLSVEGEVKVADFGVALVRKAGEHRLPGGIVGKPDYMAPEQYMGREIDARADIFAMGVLLYELLGGALPFEGQSESERQDAAKRGDFGRVRDLRPELSPELDAVLRQALAPNPDDRFPDAKAMARALSECALPLAESDDAADLVREALRSIETVDRSARPVIALSADRPGIEEEKEERGAHELTRSGGAMGQGAFSLRGRPTERYEGIVARKGEEAVHCTVTEPDRSHDFRSSSVGWPLRIVDEPAPSATSEYPPELFNKTLRAPLDPKPALLEEPKNPVLAPSAFPKQRSWWIAALLVFCLGAFFVFFVIQTLKKPGEQPLESAPSTLLSASSLSSAVPEPSKPRADSLPPPQSTKSTNSSAPSSVPRNSSRPAAPSSPTSALPPAPSLASAPMNTPAPPPEECMGTLKIASNGSFSVSGGPAVVQSPGLYTWRCGSYNLRAVSRADPSQSKSASVVIRAGGTAVVDLR